MNVIHIKNPKAATVTVEYSTGNDPTCATHKVLAQPIPPGDKLTLTITPPTRRSSAACALAGTSKWSVEPLKGGKGLRLTINSIHDRLRRGLATGVTVASPRGDRRVRPSRSG